MLIPVVYPPREPAPPPQFSPPPPPKSEEPAPAPPPPPEPPATEPAPEGDVPWMLYLLRVLGLCAFPVGIVIAGVIVLLGLDQAQETLLSLEVGSVQTAILVAAFALWLLLAWYTSRLLLDRRFKPDSLGECMNPRFADGLRRWLPRALIVGGGLPIAVFFLMQARERLIGVALLAVTGGLSLFVWRRRAWLLKLKAGSRLARWLALDGHREAIALLQREDRMGTPSRVVIALVLLLQWAIFASLIAWPEATARALGSPALVLFAMGSWIVFGGILVTYVPKALIRIPLTALPLLLFVAFAPLNDNHRVAAPERSAATPLASRQPADAWVQTWLRTVGADGKRPLVLVAVAGGASRAAYWGSASMARLQDLGEQQGVNFADSRLRHQRHLGRRFRRGQLCGRHRRAPPGRRCRQLHALEAGARLHRPRPPRHPRGLHAVPRPGAALPARGHGRRGPLPGAGAGPGHATGPRPWPANARCARPPTATPGVSR